MLRLDAQAPIELRSSKVHALFNFMETMKGMHSTSRTLREFGQVNIPASETDFYDAIEVFKTIQLDYSAKREGFPEKRHHHLSTRDLIIIASVNSRDIDDFSERITAYLPHQDHYRFIQCMKTVAPYYQKHIWDESDGNTKKIMDQIEPYKEKIQLLFDKTKQFYGSFWSDDFPFIVSLYPIPGTRGYTTATPHGNVLVGGFMTDNHKDYKGRMGVMVHEMCHIIYGEQPLELQHELERWFTQSPSPYADYAYNYLDEGLATAIGNGWAFEQLHGYVDTLEWYNDPHIDQYAHALFPMVKDYLEHGKTIDQDFVHQAIDIFAKEFPQSIYEYALLMNRIRFYNDIEDHTAMDVTFNTLNNHFNVRSAHFSTPILHERSVALMNEKKLTKLFIISENHTATFRAIAKELPSLEKYLHKAEGDFILTYQDESSQSPIILISIDDLSNVDSAFKKLAELKYLDAKQAIYPL